MTKQLSSYSGVLVANIPVRYRAQSDLFRHVDTATIVRAETRVWLLRSFQPILGSLRAARRTL